MSNQADKFKEKLKSLSNEKLLSTYKTFKFTPIIIALFDILIFLILVFLFNQLIMAIFAIAIITPLGYQFSKQMEKMYEDEIKRRKLKI